MKSRILAVLLLSLAPAAASAQPAPVYGPALPPQPGASTASPTAALPPQLVARALDYAERLARTPLDEPPKRLERKDFYDMEKFAAWAEGLRGQRELAAFLGEALKSDDAKRRFGARRAEQMQKQMDAVVKNRDAHLAALTAGYTDELKARAEDARIRANQPSIGLPSRPGRPRKIMSPQYMVATEGLIPSPYGDAIGVGSMVKGAPRFLGILDAINTGYSAGGWMGNEVIIKAQMAENYKRQREYEAAVKDWDKNVKPLWEENERRRRADRTRAAQLQFRIYVALYGYPAPNPALGTFSGPTGYGGGRYGSPYGGIGTYGRYPTPPASGAGILRD